MASEPIEVRIPNADTAQRRHQRDIVLNVAARSGPIMPKLFTATSATNATRNKRAFAIISLNLSSNLFINSDLDGQSGITWIELYLIGAQKRT